MKLLSINLIQKETPAQICWTNGFNFPLVLDWIIECPIWKKNLRNLDNYSSQNVRNDESLILEVQEILSLKLVPGIEFELVKIGKNRKLLFSGGIQSIFFLPPCQKNPYWIMNGSWICNCQISLQQKHKQSIDNVRHNRISHISYHFFYRASWPWWLNDCRWKISWNAAF